MVVKKIKDQTIILDLDDCCVGFTQFLILTHNRIHGTTYAPKDISSWDLPTDLNNLYKRFENHGLYAALPVLPGVKEAIDHFKLVMGLRIILLTARPERFGEDTYLHLKTHGIKFDELIFQADKVKAIREIAKRLHVIAFADDKLETIEKVNEKCRVDHIFLINMPHNQKEDLDPDIIRVESLFETIRHIKAE
jgi:uncharacterized HAD superfamily protein